jgi:tRNA(Arg) A34 adenosine deaminase TadA
MCAAASYWAGIERIFYGATVDDALEYGGFDDSMIFAQLRHPTTKPDASRSANSPS